MQEEPLLFAAPQLHKIALFYLVCQLICPNTYGMITVTGHILQDESQHAFLPNLTSCAGNYKTYIYISRGSTDALSYISHGHVAYLLFQLLCYIIFNIIFRQTNVYPHSFKGHSWSVFLHWDICFLSLHARQHMTYSCAEKMHIYFISKVMWKESFHALSTLLFLQWEIRE